jgi:hypothetical protein
LNFFTPAAAQKKVFSSSFFYNHKSFLNQPTSKLTSLANSLALFDAKNSAGPPQHSSASVHMISTTSSQQMKSEGQRKLDDIYCAQNESTFL